MLERDAKEFTKKKNKKKTTNKQNKKQIRKKEDFSPYNLIFCEKKILPLRFHSEDP